MDGSEELGGFVLAVGLKGGEALGGEEVGGGDAAELSPVVAVGREADGAVEEEEPGGLLDGAVGEGGGGEKLPGDGGDGGEHDAGGAQAQGHEGGGAVGVGEAGQGHVWALAH